jgi:hypothetical protein
MKPIAVPPDAEHVVVDYLTAQLAARSSTATVGVNVPSDWTPGRPAHVQVAHDGTPVVEYPALFRASVRVTCWDEATTDAKALASLCLAVLLAHPGDRSVGSIRPLTGVLPARDPDTSAQLATIAVQVNLRGAVTD